MLTLAAGLVLLLVVFLLIGIPLVRPEPAGADAFGTEASDAAATGGDPDAEARELLFKNLNEIEVDYRMGKLSHEDYESLKDEYTQEAIVALKKEEEAAAGLDGGETSPVAIDEGLDEEIETLVRMETAALCPHCGLRLLRPDQSFCHACGGRVTA